ncbi:hypothetical protein KQ879_15220, partial [Listeria monocytogenes]|nr:hypothetical protein [Listeria monocytogenes]
VMQHMHDNLTGYKRPKAVEFRDSLPTTNVGKILRRELRAEELKKAGQKYGRRCLRTPRRCGASSLQAVGCGVSGPVRT